MTFGTQQIDPKRLKRSPCGMLVAWSLSVDGFERSSRRIGSTLWMQGLVPA